jgi:hypothetical protein
MLESRLSNNRTDINIGSLEDSLVSFLGLLFLVNFFIVGSCSYLEASNSTLLVERSYLSLDLPIFYFFLGHSLLVGRVALVASLLLDSVASRYYFFIHIFLAFRA